MSRILFQPIEAWGRREEERLAAAGRPLTAEEQQSFEGFFEPALLQSARVVILSELAKQPIYAQFLSWRLPMLGFRSPAALTVGRTILMPRRLEVDAVRWRSLLFHELVHVAQYRALGIGAFIGSYLHAWAWCGFSYERIPYEVMARELQQRYQADPGRAFSVGAEVVRAIEETRTA